VVPWLLQRNVEVVVKGMSQVLRTMLGKSERDIVQKVNGAGES